MQKSADAVVSVGVEDVCKVKNICASAPFLLRKW